MIWIIDNYDSFTYNLVEAFRKLNASVQVVANDELTLKEVQEQQDKISAFLISPGPGSPKEARLSCDIVKHFYDKRPILGVCLGHQVICEHFGAQVIPASRIMHGKVSDIQHDGLGLFKNIEQNFSANRYHSLIASPEGWPQELEISAWTDYGSEKEIMAVRHRQYAIESVQFHPESILTPRGQLLIGNFLEANQLV